MDDNVISPAGRIIRRWRRARGLSQMDLAQDAEISTRHMSFIETGRTSPSRAALHRIARALELPLRDHNALLHAAGYAPLYGESDLNAPEMAHVRGVLDFVLSRHEPFGALVLDGADDIVMTNAAAANLMSFLLDPAALIRDGRLNLMRLLFHPDGAHRFIVNWPEVAAGMLVQLHRAADLDPGRAGALLQEALAYPAAPADWRPPDPSEPPLLLLPVRFRKGEVEFGTFSTIMVFAAPQDVTLQELRLETFFPADAQSEAILRAIGRGEPLPRPDRRQAG